jgi:hypothetical protein
MSGALAKNIADLQYGGLYLPLFTLFYLFDKLQFPYAIVVLDHRLATISTTTFQILFGITFVGALVKHGLNRSIYGPEGPLQNPKNPWTVRYQKAALTFHSSPSRCPATYDDMIAIGASSVERVETILEYFIEGTIVQRILVCWHIFKSVLRTVVILVSRPIYTAVVFGSIVLLYDLVVSTNVDYLGAGLFISQTAFFFGAILLNWFPSVVPTDSARWVFVPEYRKSPDLYDKDEIEFEYDPRGLQESVKERVEKFQMGARRTERREDEVEYLIPIEEDGSTDYLVPLDDSER